MTGPRTRPATIYDVAERAGVSKSLVSLVLRDSPRVSDARREAVVRAMAELDYRPSTAAVSLAGTRTRTIGVVLDDFRNQWFVDILTGLRESLEGQGLRLVVADRFLNTGLDATPIEGFLSMRVEGIVIAGEPDPDHVVPSHTPVVVAGGRARVEGADTIANDDHAGGRLATEHLLALGHRRIGHVTTTGSRAALERRAGFDAALAAAPATDLPGPATDPPAPAADLPAPATHLRSPVADLRSPTIALDGPMTEATGAAAAARLLAEHPDVTAIFAANDVMALGALSVLAERGLRVPDDVSVVGYDDTPFAAARFIDLTSVDDRSTDIGRAAGATLLARIADHTREPTETLVAPTLVVRGSTAPPRAD
ncbi:LacI family DNA-binding transcriptional regulator [Curtobacterium sp. RRHDQ10]|uniref:LacI family DNA-binding transcriptional regulator n=1 Tax=Curtobacterium phyllosphaerae TaxID=3413379 RepID=UPI003BF31548